MRQSGASVRAHNFRMSDCSADLAREYRLADGRTVLVRVNQPMLKFVRALGFDVRVLTQEPTLAQVVKDLRQVPQAVA